MCDANTISMLMQAAKYFTFIFFGLSVFVILLFGGFVLCHCYRRLRYDRDNDSGPQVCSLAAMAVTFDGLNNFNCTIASLGLHADAASSPPPANADRSAASWPVPLLKAKAKCTAAIFMLLRHAGIPWASGTVTPSQ